MAFGGVRAVCCARKGRTPLLRVASDTELGWGLGAKGCGKTVNLRYHNSLP